ncbi:MAG TPA: AAA family ATPase, partial [Acidimicrobiales bacterium]|nr:AAA family ATPase [Acidimicrobiales bacterium]
MTVGILLLSYVLVVANSRPRVSGDRLRLDQFVALVGRGDILDARILDQDEFVVGTYRRADGSQVLYNVPYVAGAGHSNVPDLLVQSQVPTEVDHQFSKRLLGPATLILPALIVVVVFVYLILSYQRGSGLFSVRSGAIRATGGDGANRVTFADVAGQDAALAELREVKEFLTDPARFAAMGAAVPKGILLFGPPGCGKTLVARALAGEAGVEFFSISGSDFVELYAGVGASRVRELFREARAHAPAIVFIDELDSVGRRRGGRGPTGGNEEQEQALNQILAELDGFSPLEGIIVIGATNRPDVLDPALLRPGRFDRTIGLERPDEAGRLAILSRHAAHKHLATDVDLADVARRAIGLTGADLASVMNEAALLAARDGHDAISQIELDQSLLRILEAPARQRRLSLREASVGQRFAAEEKVTFADVAGADDAMEELGDVREYLAHPEVFAAMGPG